VDCDGPIRTVLAEYDALHVGFVEPAGYDVLLSEPGGVQPSAKLFKDGDPIAPVTFGIDQIVELSIPFDRLGLRVDQPLQFFVELLEGGQSRDRAPREGTLSLTCPSPDFEQIMWDV
jgi:hypothetical protein